MPEHIPPFSRTSSRPGSHQSIAYTPPIKEPAGADPSTDQIVANRTHRIYAARYDQMRLAMLALDGGRRYINARLSRFPGESTVDWDDSSGTIRQSRIEYNAIPVEGRKQRAYLVNHAARIAEKIRQYVFAKPPEREGVDTDMMQDITRRGQSLNCFMGQVLRYLVGAGWCWIGVDAPRVDGKVSLAQAKSGKVRPYWNLYSPLDVVDWHFDEKGELTWLLTEGIRYDNSNPRGQSTEQPIRRLWEPGRVTEYDIKPPDVPSDDAVVLAKRTVPHDFPGVPFTLAGVLSATPHWFEDVEDVQRAILDIESSLDTLFLKCVFGQLVLPRSAADAFMGESNGADLAKVVAGVIGYSNAILEGDTDRGITRYIGPDASAIQSLQKELGRKREILFDTVGLHLGFTKDFSEAKEAKDYDNLDPQAVLRNYAQQIGEAETKAWELTHQWSPSVTVVEPKYADKFRVTDIYEDLKGLTLVSQMDLPESMQKLNLRGVLDSVLEITNLSLTQDEYDQVVKDIEAHDFSEPIDLTPGSLVAGVAKQATDDGEGVRASGAEDDDE